MSSCFCTKPVAPNSAPPDPGKHVNYVQGMVLGVDDFTQEFAYLSGRDRWLARDAIGYGTLRGLALSWMKDGAGKLQPKVMVTAGTALTPCGQLVCIPSSQCADINQWLAATERDAEITSRLEAGSKLTLHVTLAYSDCPTDDTPIPGEPCRSAEDLMQPSRITDSFQLELSWDAPLQVEEDALRSFYAWLRNNITLVSQPDEATPLGDYINAIRAWETTQTKIAITQTYLPEYTSVALRLWVTELRPNVERSAALKRFKLWLENVPHSATGTATEQEFIAEIYRWKPETDSWQGNLIIKTSDKSSLINKALKLWDEKIAPQWYGDPCGCGASCNSVHCDDRLLLGTISFKVKRENDKWCVAGPLTADSLSVDESRRPIIGQLRALEAQLVPMPETGTGSPSASAASGTVSYRHVAMGRVKHLSTGETQTTPVFGNLELKEITNPGVVSFTFTGYSPPDDKHDYVMQVIASYYESATQNKSQPAVRFGKFESDHFSYKVTRSNKEVPIAELKLLEFQVEVTLIVKPN